MDFLGEVYPGLIANGLCYPLLGCNSGFFGYDALEHLVSGMVVGLALLWLNRRTLGQVLAWSLCAALSWELLEWCYDTARAAIFHMDLLHPTNTYAQPTGLDTLGDVAFGLAGALAVYALFAARRMRRDTVEA